MMVPVAHSNGDICTFLYMTRNHLRSGPAYLGVTRETINSIPLGEVVIGHLSD